MLVYRLDASRPASLVEKRGDDTEIEIMMCYLNGFDLFRHRHRRLITYEQGNRRIRIFIEVLLGIGIKRTVEIGLPLRLPRRQLLVDGSVRELLAELGWNLACLDQLHRPDGRGGEQGLTERRELCFNSFEVLGESDFLIDVAAIEDFRYLPVFDGDVDKVVSRATSVF